MKRLLFKFCSSFIMFYVALAIYAGILLLFQTGIDLVNFIFPALTYAAVLTTIEFIIFKKKGYGLNEKAVFFTEKDVVDEVKKVGIQQNWKTEEKEGNIILRTPVSLYSFGERILVIKTETGTVVKSESSLVSTIFDFGKNLDNIYLLKKAVA